MTINHQKLLQGHYEADRLPSDFSRERIVPDFAFNVLNPLGLLYRPVVDEDYLQNGGKKPIWPTGKPFAVCLTHDVDAITLFSLRQSLQHRSSQLSIGETGLHKAKALLRIGLYLVRAANNGLKKGPFHCYEHWLEIEKKSDARSTFFF